MPIRFLYLATCIGIVAWTVSLHVLSYIQTISSGHTRLAVALSLAAFAPAVIEVFRKRRRGSDAQHGWSELWTEVMERCPRWIVIGTNVGYWLFVLCFVAIFFGRDSEDSAFTAWAMAMAFAGLSHAMTTFRRPRLVNR